MERRNIRDEVDPAMQQLGDWLDRTMAFLAGLLGSFIGLIIA